MYYWILFTITVIYLNGQREVRKESKVREMMLKWFGIRLTRSGNGNIFKNSGLGVQESIGAVIYSGRGNPSCTWLLPDFVNLHLYLVHVKVLYGQGVQVTVTKETNTGRQKYFQTLNACKCNKSFEYIPGETENKFVKGTVLSPSRLDALIVAVIQCFAETESSSRYFQKG